LPAGGVIVACFFFVCLFCFRDRANAIEQKKTARRFQTPERMLAKLAATRARWMHMYSEMNRLDQECRDLGEGLIKDVSRYAESKLREIFGSDLASYTTIKPTRICSIAPIAILKSGEKIQRLRASIV